MSQLRIFIADPGRDGRLALQMLLDHEPGMKVVGIAVQQAGLVEQVTAVKPDVILIDWQLLMTEPTALINKLHTQTTPCCLFVLDVRPETEEKAITAGADAFVSKSSPPDDLLQILRQLKKRG